MPEETKNFIRIPNPKHTEEGCQKIRTIAVSPSKGISALYCIDHKKIKTYLFDKAKGWTMKKAQAWVKEHQKEYKMEKLYTKAYLERDEEGKMIAVASEEVEDREGEVLSIDGWQLNNFKKNPILLWMHNRREDRLPIGRASSISKRTIEGVKKLVFTPLFEEITEFGQTVKKFYEEGLLNTFSVGFMPLEQEGNKFLKQELLEISAVPVPALASAEVISRAKGLGFAKETISQILNIEEKGVIPFASHPKAPEDTDWNAPSEVAQAEVSDLKKMCTWFDSENTDLKSAYKLPHHKKEGYKTVWRGVAAAMAALLGARGGVQIPSEDRKGVYNHLAKHYKEFDKEVPEFRSLDEIVEKYIEKSPLDIKLLDFDLEERLIKIEENLAYLVKKPAVSPSLKSKEDFGRGDTLQKNRRLLQAIDKILEKILKDTK